MIKPIKILAMVSLLSLSWCCSNKTLEPLNEGVETYKIGVYNNGVHLSYLFATETCVDWWEFVEPKSYDVRKAKYLLFGWGDYNFYQSTPTWDDFSVSAGLEALFFSSGSVVHVTGIKVLFGDDDFLEVVLTKKECVKLAEYVQSSFQSDGAGPITPLSKGYTEVDYFYLSPLRYSLFNTCNNWIASGFSRLGFDLPLWSGLAGPVFESLKNSNRVVR